VRVDVAAIGVNYADCVIRMGLYASAKEFVGWPITPGFEVAGVVSACGAGVDGWPIGQAVFGVTRFGGYAAQVVVPQSRCSRGRRAERGAGGGAAAIFLTADYAAHELARAQPGSWVLVHSAAGGVGSALVQILKGDGLPGGRGGRRGAQGRGGARSLGADVVIDKSRADLWAAGPGERAGRVRGDLRRERAADAARELSAPGAGGAAGGLRVPRDAAAPGRAAELAGAGVDFVRTPWFSPLDAGQREPGGAGV
jgi:NADPH:quinone reductase-like Zn-dependent oxidoreductase